ncbi:Putative uncharacterized protein [Staphylococcus xylosus]|nr:Putative uncharacterized protein [Staphylococcus xylosus]
MGSGCNPLKRRGFQRKKDALNAEKELLEEYKKP